MKKRIFRSKSTNHQSPITNTGFSIVELIIVIVVIAIVSVIGLTRFNEEINNSRADSLRSGLSNASKQLNVDQIRNSAGDFPPTLAAANSGAGINFSSNTTVSYNVDNNANPKTFCLSVTQNSQSYFITQDTIPIPGPCRPILYLDAGIASSYSGSGTEWKDVSGYGNNGITCNNIDVPTQYTFSNLNGGALLFNANSSTNIPSTPALNFTNDGSFSISVWIKPDTVASGWIRGIIVQEAYLISGYRLGIVNGGKPQFWTTQSGGTLSMTSATQSLAVNRWANVTITYNNQQAYMYINGAQAASATGTYFAGDNSVIVRVGSNVVEYYSGLMGVVSVYDRELTSTEAKNIFETTRSRFGV